MNKILNLPFVQAYLKMLSRMTDYKGREDRETFWWAVLGNVILITIVSCILKLFGSFGSVLAFLVSLVLCVPMIMMGIRRMHDVSKPGWWIVVPVMDIIFAIQPGVPGDNEYGADPKSNLGY